ncbi:hypothetical protein HNR16_001699 [Pseudoclavibacter chungangensis]|nr:hypothetical protein [Pseudoclavibacter chungangensis]NYJ66911.1 hypothetical protein [Pseudoclavibacter chungangensis]
MDTVAHALLAVATRSAEAGACSDDEPDELGTFLAQRLAPFVEHLRAMLP